MTSYRTSRTLPTILTVIIIIVAIAGLVALARLLFSGASSSDSTEEVNTARQSLLTTSDGHAVRMTVRGPIVADEDFRSYQITISPNNRTFEAYTGYLDTVTSSEKLTNNTAAYEQFVNALDKARLGTGRQLSGEDNNVAGVCATGRVYEFSIMNGGSTDAYYWTSTCSGSAGSLKANVTQVSALFLSQIPDSSTIDDSLEL